MAFGMTMALDPLGLWLDKPAPRYTSYPPATAFHSGVSEGDYCKALAQISDHQSVSLYLHIPFCRELCLYCGCHTTITRRDDRIADYLAALHAELALLSPNKPRRISHIHFGGGTPNILSDHQFHSLFETLHRHYDFSDCKDIAVELDPRNVTPDKIKAMAACGVTRVSLGVQDYAPAVQALINRIQPQELVERVTEELRAAGITRINFDLMYGLPRQTLESVTATARAVAQLRPDRIALFSYAHVPQIKKHQQPLEDAGLPDSHSKLAMETAARDVFMAAGYSAIGMDHFALPTDSLSHAQQQGRLHRNFQGYTDDNETILLGVGASSISQTPSGFYQNERDIAAYQTAIAQGILPITRGYTLTAHDLLCGAVIEELMCNFHCDVEAVCARHHTDIAVFHRAFEQLRPYEESGMIKREGWSITLTTPHRMAIRAVVLCFDHHAHASSRVPASRVA